MRHPDVCRDTAPSDELGKTIRGAQREPTQGMQGAAYWLRSAYSHEPHRPGLSPTRYGDWEYNGRCTDF